MNLITLNASGSASITFEGYQYDTVEYVLLSSSNLTDYPVLCSIDLFKPDHRAFAAFSPVSGYPWKRFRSSNKNYLIVDLLRNEIISPFL